jgi:cytoskeletal protein CcmA (bactofilin family)
MADVTVVGQTMFLRGSIRGEGDLEIHGRVEGEIEVSGEVTIAEGALVKADVTGRRIVVRGAVAGDLAAEQGVRLEDGARVVGDIHAATVGILEGALLRGNLETGERASGSKKQARTAQGARPASRLEARPQARKAPVEDERPAPPPPIVPVLRRGTRAAMKKRGR